MTAVRTIQVPGGRAVRVTPVFDTYWKFACMRQDVYMSRVLGAPAPWTTDPTLSVYKFTNAYRASDRVSQYLIRNVIYEGSREPEEVFFRIMLFKLFNKIETWELLTEALGVLEWRSFDARRYSAILDREMAQDRRLYSAAYIMPSPAYGNARKHRNHLALLEQMMLDAAPHRVASAASLEEVFEILRSYPSLGAFLAFQFAIDLNYSPLVDFLEMDFVVAGPGARDGIQKCFADTAGLSEADIIKVMADIAEREFLRLGLDFQTLWGRKLQLIDCQNLFCEVGKYARVAHPEWTGDSGRTRIKQRFRARGALEVPFYPPKWELSIGPTSPRFTGPAGHHQERPASQAASAE